MAQAFFNRGRSDGTIRTPRTSNNAVRKSRTSNNTIRKSRMMDALPERLSHLHLERTHGIATRSPLRDCGEKLAAMPFAIALRSPGGNPWTASSTSPHS
jgi:hypothetical protein